MVTKLFLLAYALGALASCGTLRSGHQVLSVNSDPAPTTAIYMPEGEKQRRFVTPDFIEVERNKEQVFRFKTPKDELIERKEDCNVRWIDSVTSNLLLTAGAIAYSTPIGAAVGAIFFGTDYFNDNMWSCDTKVMLAPARKNKQRTCTKVAIVSPEHSDPIVGDVLAARWRRVVRKKSKHCFKFIYTPDSKALLYRLGINTSKDRLTDMDVRARIGNELDVDRLVFLKYETKGKKTVIVTPTFFDLHTGRFTRVETLRLKSTDRRLAKQVQKVNPISWSLSLLPNTIYYSLVEYRNVDSTENLLTKTNGLKEHSNVPTYLQGISLSQVLLPDLYNNYDADWELYPSLGFFYRKISFDTGGDSEGIFNTDSGETDEPITRYHVEYLHLLPLFNTGPTFFTPIGNFALHLSLGAGYTWAKDNEGMRVSEVNWAGGCYLAYYAFMSENFYMSLYAKILRIYGDAPIESDHITSQNLSSIGIGVGYYLSTLAQTSWRRLNKR